ncbi:MAG: DegT/DnrJ/EryC1/StrS family aminotransferase [Candidatus Xenobia bacterium]
MVPHNRLTYGRAEASAVREAVSSGQWAQGPRVARLEQVLAQTARVKHAVCLGSGLAALRLALLASGIKSGDEVWVPAYSCVALPNAVLSCGGVAVPVDVCSGTWTFNPEAAPRRRPRAAIVVHTFGAISNLPAGVPVVEDCTHSFGERPVTAKVGVLSLYATKLLAAGEGGALLTNDARIAKFARQWRDYSNQEPDGSRLNDKMSDLEAAVGLCQADRLAAGLKARRQRAGIYHRQLSRVPGRWRLPPWDPARVWYRYVLEVPSASRTQKHLHEAGVETALPVHPWLSPDVMARYPVSRDAFKRLLSLPLYPTLTRIEQQRVIDAVCGMK